MPKRDLNALVRELLQNLGSPVDKVPPGWYSSEDLAKLLGVTKGAILKKLRKITIEKRKFRVRRGACVLNLPHYNLGDLVKNPRRAGG